MRVAATSDWHLGHRRHAASLNGRNLREIDVERALFAAVKNIVEADPDLVLVPGDLFDNARPSYTAALGYRRAVRQLVEDTRAVIILLQGNHCAVRTAGSTTPDRIVEDYERVHVVTQPRRIRFTTDAGEEVAVAAFPFTALQEEESYALEPVEDADLNVLTLHGAVKSSDDADALPYFYTSGRSLDVGEEADRWSMIVAGDYHDFRRLHPDRLAFYPGAIERVSSDPWSEDGEKGVVLADTDTGELEFVPHEVRGLHDYDVSDLLEHALGTADNVNYALEQIADLQPVHQGAIVRLVVDDFPREEREQVDWSLVRDLKATCLHFQLDLRWAETSAASFRDRREGPARTLEDDARAFFEDDDEEVRETALSYLGVEDEQEDVVYHCPECGNRDTDAPGNEPPCSGGCGARMVEGSPPDRQLAATGGTR